MGENIRERLREVSRALRHRDYRIYFFGMLVSFTGTWMQHVAQSWLVYRLTGSAWLLGLVGFAGQVPVFLFSPLGGVMADRHSRHRLVVLTQTFSMVQAFLLAWLTMSGRVTVEWVLVLALMLGVANAFDMPARQSLVAELVGKQDLMNAIALNSSMINIARVAGPALAGVMVASFGEGICFLVNALSYIIVLAGLLSMRNEKREQERLTGSTLSNMKEGFAYIRHTVSVGALLALVAIVSVCGLPYIVLMPIFADEILGGGARGLGFMMGAAGMGALAGALTLAARRQVEGLGRVVARSVVALGALLVLFAASRNLALSAALLVPIGFSLMLQLPASNTLLQMVVPDRMRGRVMSFYSMSLMGMTPFGNLLAGAIAARIGAPKTVAAGGVLCLVGVLLLGRHLPSLRREAKPVSVAQKIRTDEPEETKQLKESAPGSASQCR
ncbi:MAG: MFS transporter [Blastocatellia bacterium]|nr:MFS transporter [Blastocatellia bacterium]